MTGRLRLGLLHTVPALAGTFDRLGAQVDADLELVHVVDGSLLARAIEEGAVSEEVSDRAVAHTRYLAGLGVDAVLVTCSSIGECADLAAQGGEVPVVRVDRPMARRAVALASAAGARGRIAVLATLESTLGPTRRLLEAEVHASAVAVTVADAVVAGAAPARSAGDQARHDALVREAVAAAAAESDVVVLAQASMADALAADPPETGGVEVLSSPVTGLQAAVDAAAGGRG